MTIKIAKKIVKYSVEKPQDKADKEAAQKAAADKEASMKADLRGEIDHMQKQAQVWTDSVFSFAELGFQEFETSKYLTAIL